ncbi:MAG: hypothetical protein ACREOV_05535 [Candidatus Dormibacteraceae bacterium]
MVRCQVLGHRFRFSAAGETMRWACQRDCGAGGSKRYASAADAREFASAFDREDREGLGRRAPFLGMFPLRVWYRLRVRRQGGVS